MNSHLNNKEEVQQEANTPDEYCCTVPIEICSKHYAEHAFSVILRGMSI